jgi:hypothetical protein
MKLEPTRVSRIKVFFTMDVNILLVGENVGKFKRYLEKTYTLTTHFETILIHEVEVTTFTVDTSLGKFKINMVVITKPLLNFETKKVYNFVDSILILNEFAPLWLKEYGNKFTILSQYGSIGNILALIYDKIYVRHIELRPCMNEMDSLVDSMSRLYI